MDTDYDFRPLPYEIDHFLDGMGDNLLHRYQRLAYHPADSGRLLRTIRKDIELTGIAGLISLIRVLIAETPRRRTQLLRKGRAICGSPWGNLFEATLNNYEGHEPGPHIWHRDERGIYQLNAVA